MDAAHGETRFAPAGPYATFDVVPTELGFPEGPIALPDGSWLAVEIANGCLTHIDPDGKKTVAAHTDGGPNGAAVGPDGAIYICNNGGFAWDCEPGMQRPTTQAADNVSGCIQRVDVRAERLKRSTPEARGRQSRRRDHPSGQVQITHLAAKALAPPSSSR